MAGRRLLTALAAVGALAIGTAGAIAAKDLAGAPREGRPLVLSGSVDGLAPGVVVDIPLRVANPNPLPIDVTSVSTTVTSPQAGCPASAVHAGDLRSRVRVPAKGSAVGSAPIVLDRDAPDACQNVEFALRFRTTAHGAGTLPPSSTVPKCRRVSVRTRVVRTGRNGKRVTRIVTRTKIVCPTTCRKVRSRAENGRWVTRTVCCRTEKSRAENGRWVTRTVCCRTQKVRAKNGKLVTKRVCSTKRTKKVTRR